MRTTLRPVAMGTRTHADVGGAQQGETSGAQTEGAANGAGAYGHDLLAFPSKPFTIERARNATLWDSDGDQYTDLGGASHGVAVLGHNHPRVVRAIQEQSERLLHVATTVPNARRDRFLQRLHRALPARLERTFLTNSGTEAVECAMKLARNATGRRRFLAARGSFHGRTLGALSLTHNPAFRTPYQGLLPQSSHAPFNDVDALAEAMGHDIAAIVLEPIQGEGGLHPATTAYLQAARELADQYGALLVFDEVQSSLRTGTFLASRPSGVIPDMVTLGKGLAGGVPIGACSVTGAVADALPPGGHGTTYGGNPLACAAGNAVLDVLAKTTLIHDASAAGQRLQQRLRSLDHPAIRDVRGRGLMVGVELAVRRAPVLARLQEQGFLALPAGRRAIRFLPPLTTPPATLDAIAPALAEALP